MNTQRILAAGLISICLLATACATGAPQRPNILLITLDTTRADHLGCYGYDLDTSPNIDALARESRVYTRALSTASWTLPAHASLFTGKLTWSHGARYDPEGPLRLLDAIDGRPSWETYRARGLAPDERTLAATLRDAGYRTGATVGGPWLKRVFGLDKGFEHYDDQRISTVAGRPADSLTDDALKWLEGVREDPFFLFLNYFDPHEPLNPPSAYLSRFMPQPAPDFGQRRLTDTERIALYDAEIRFMDYHVARLLQKLKDWELYDDTWIIVTADHGQLLGEHGRYDHGLFLYQEEIHIPLIVKAPGGTEPAGRDDRRIQLTDIFPWICDRLELSCPEDLQGSVPPEIDHPIVAETYPLPAMTTDGAWRTLVDDDLKFVWNSAGRHQLFDLGQDPGEQQNLYDEQPDRARELFRRMESYLGELPRPADIGDIEEIDPETREALESLGYL